MHGKVYQKIAEWVSAEIFACQTEKLDGFAVVRAGSVQMPDGTT